MRKRKRERNSVCRKNNGTLFPLMFWIIQDIRNVFATFPSPLSPVLFARLFFFPPLSSSFTSLHSSPANFAQPIQTRRPVDPSQPNLLFIRFYFFSLSFSLQSSCISFDRRCRFFDRQNVVARRLVFVTRNQPVYPVICTPCTCKYSLIFV